MSDVSAEQFYGIIAAIFTGVIAVFVRLFKGERESKKDILYNDNDLKHIEEKLKSIDSCIERLEDKLDEERHDMSHAMDKVTDKLDSMNDKFDDLQNQFINHLELGRHKFRMER